MAGRLSYDGLLAACSDDGFEEGSAESHAGCFKFSDCDEGDGAAVASSLLSVLCRHSPKLLK